jgi:glycosyltransferase involved in cell wall biosynthesis
VTALDPGIKFGSLEEQILLLARGFRERGAAFVPVFARPLQGSTLAAFEAEGLEVECVDLRTYRLDALRRLLHLIDDRAIELVHWNFYHPLNAYVWSLTLVRPHLMHYLTDHNSRPSAPPPPRWGLAGRAIKKVLLRRYRRIVCVSDFVAEVLRRNAPAGHLTTCPHFINTDRFRPDPAVRGQVRNEFRTDGRFVVLLVAHLIPEKGGEMLLRALAELPRVEAWIAGDGPEGGRLRRVAEEVGVAKQVRFLGNQAEVQRYMQAADCLVCPSLWQEAAGLVNIEALACGLPVVASRIGGIPEIVEHGRTGLLFESGNVGELAAALRCLLEKPELREEMGRAARSTADARYAAERRIPEYLDLYRVETPGEQDAQ